MSNRTNGGEGENVRDGTYIKKATKSALGSSLLQKVHLRCRDVYEEPLIQSMSTLRVHVSSRSNVISQMIHDMWYSNNSCISVNSCLYGYRNAHHLLAHFSSRHHDVLSRVNKRTFVNKKTHTCVSLYLEHNRLWIFRHNCLHVSFCAPSVGCVCLNSRDHPCMFQPTSKRRAFGSAFRSSDLWGLQRLHCSYLLLTKCVCCDLTYPASVAGQPVHLEDRPRRVVPA